MASIVRRVPRLLAASRVQARYCSSATFSASLSNSFDESLRESFRRYRTEQYGTLCSVREMKHDFVRAVDPEGTEFAEEGQLRKVLHNMDCLSESDITKMISIHSVQGKGVPVQHLRQLLA